MKFDYRGIELLVSKEDLLVLRAGIEEIDRNTPPLLSVEADLLHFIRQITMGQEPIRLDDDQHESLKFLCSRVDLASAPEGEDGFSLATAQLLRQLKAKSTISCERCGSRAFSGSFFSYFSEASWLGAEESRPLQGSLRGLMGAAEGLIMSILENLNGEDVEVEDDLGNARVSSEVSEEVACLSCSEPLALPADAFPDQGGDPQVPREAIAPWGKRISWGGRDALEHESRCESPDRNAVACPACKVGEIELFAQRVRVEHRAGKQSGVFEFKEASSFDTHEVWDSRLLDESTSIQFFGQDDYLAEADYRVGMRCSRACWEVRGIELPLDIPSALVAICGLIESTESESRDGDGFDLWHVVTALQPDTAEQESLLSRAKDWIDSSESDPAAMERAHHLLVQESVEVTIYAEGLTTLVGHPELKGAITDLYISGTEQLESFEGLETCIHLRSIAVNEPMPALHDLDGLANCRRLSSVFLEDCPVLHNIAGLERCTLLKELYIEGSEKLVSVDALASCEYLESVNLCHNAALRDVGALAGCTRLTSLGLPGPAAKDTEALLAALPRLTSLALDGGEEVTSIDGIRHCAQLTELHMTSCVNLRDIEGIEGLDNLKYLHLDNCTSLEHIEPIADCKSLKSITLKGCTSLQSVDVLASCHELTTLDLTSCVNLRDIEAIEGLDNLKYLYLGDCTSLEHIEPIADCKSLKSITLKGCTSLQSVDVLASCHELTTLDLTSCVNLRDIEAIEGLDNLEYLYLGNCTGLEHIEPIADCKSLKFIILDGCTSLQSVDVLASCHELTYISLRGCTALKSIDALRECPNIWPIANLPSHLTS